MTLTHRFPNILAKKQSQSRHFAMKYTTCTLNIPAICWWATNLGHCQCVTIWGHLHGMIYAHVRHHSTTAILPTLTSSLFSTLQISSKYYKAVKFVCFVLSKIYAQLLLTHPLTYCYICHFICHTVSHYQHTPDG